MTDQMLTQQLHKLLKIVQYDAGQRGLAKNPEENLFTATQNDFERSVRKLVETPACGVGIMTGFVVTAATPPALETDGPLGALFLADVLQKLGYQPFFLLGEQAARALQSWNVPRVVVPSSATAWPGFLAESWPMIREQHRVRHLITIECVGPSHADGRSYSMRGQDVSDFAVPFEFLIDEVHQSVDCHTISIGDGGNELGMGKLPRELIADNITLGEQIACRVPTDELIVAGVSNWGAYALAAGLLLSYRYPQAEQFFDMRAEEERLRKLVQECGFVDGATGQPTPTVDGLDWTTYSRVLQEIALFLVKQS